MSYNIEMWVCLTLKRHFGVPYFQTNPNIIYCYILSYLNSKPIMSKNHDGFATIPCFCQRPENRPSLFAFFNCVVTLGGVDRGATINVLSLHGLSWTVGTLHVTVHPSAVFAGHTSCYVAHVCCLRRTHNMLRCTRLLYFGGHTSCYARLL